MKGSEKSENAGYRILTTTRRLQCKMWLSLCSVVVLLLRVLSFLRWRTEIIVKTNEILKVAVRYVGGGVVYAT